jgi:hypothetical protein
MRLTPEQLEAGYWRAYRDFYRWENILQGSRNHTKAVDRFRHLAYAGGWKKFEPRWDWVIRAKRVAHLLPVLERILAGFKFQDAGVKKKVSAEAAIETET